MSYLMECSGNVQGAFNVMHVSLQAHLLEFTDILLQESLPPDEGRTAAFDFYYFILYLTIQY